MNKEYVLSRRYIYDLEFIKCEMELKKHQAVRKDVNFDTKDINNKIDLISGVQKYLNAQFEVMEDLKKKNQRLSILNETLQAKLNAK